MTTPSEQESLFPPSTFPMIGSIAGRLQRIHLPVSNGLQPLFEAITNAFQSIQKLGSQSGRIDIIIERGVNDSLIPDGPKPITNIIIKDNGVGFTEENFKSFCTPDSLLKLNIGGKGIGRLLWLKAFTQAEIQSHYQEGGKALRRTFTFMVDDATPIQNHKLDIEATAVTTSTTVKLISFNKPYREAIHPKPETLADRIIVRFMLHFLTGSNCPSVHLVDDGTHIDLNSRFKDEGVKEVTRFPLAVKGHTLDALFMQLKPGGRRKHTLHLCAAECEVETTEIEKFLPHIPPHILDAENNSTRLAVYITGTVLTNSVNEQRTAFNLPKEEDSFEPTLQEVIDASCSLVSEKFSDLICKEKERTEQRIRSFITNKRPIYRALLDSLAEHLPRLEKCTTENDLDLTLNTIVREIEINAETEFSKYRSPAQTIGEEALQKTLLKITNASRVRLSQYVARRRAVLFILKRLLRRQQNDRHSLEADIHDIVFPMGTTSNEVPIDRWNLWLLDERLSFHEHLASDRPLRTQAAVNSTSSDEPDLLVLNRPGAFADGHHARYDSVVIVEFKRPMRGDIGSGELPHEQALRYIKQIQVGKEEDLQGRPINAPQARFYCYLVCDLTVQLRERLNDQDFIPSPDNSGFFKASLNPMEKRFVYYEYISFDKLYEDAEKRNQALFHKLGITLDPDVEEQS